MPALPRKLTRQDFQQLADERLADALALLAAARPAAAYYMAGYAVECALKACIAKTIGQHEFPDKHFGHSVHVHDLKALLASAGLATALTADMNTDADVAGNWGVVANWSEGVRYYGANQEDADTIIAAITAPDKGIITWIKARW